MCKSDLHFFYTITILNFAAGHFFDAHNHEAYLYNHQAHRKREKKIRRRVRRTKIMQYFRLYCVIYHVIVKRDYYYVNGMYDKMLKY